MRASGQARLSTVAGPQPGAVPSNATDAIAKANIELSHLPQLLLRVRQVPDKRAEWYKFAWDLCP